MRGTPFLLRLNGCLKFAGLQVVDLFPSKTIAGGPLHRLARALRERGASHVCLSSVALGVGGRGAGARRTGDVFLDSPRVAITPDPSGKTC